MTGAHNFRASFGIWDGGGEILYNGTNPGTDKISITVTTAGYDCDGNYRSVDARATAVQQWVPPPPPPPEEGRVPIISAQPVHKTHQLGETTDVELRVTDAYGDHWSGTLYWSTAWLDGLSANNVGGSIDVRNGVGRFSYAGVNEGEDLIRIGTGFEEPLGDKTYGYVSRAWVGPKPVQVVTEVRPAQEVNPAGNYTDFEVLVRDQDGKPWTGSLAWSTRYANTPASTNSASGFVSVQSGTGTFGYTGASSGEDIVTVGLSGNTSTFQDASRTWTEPGPDPCDLVPLDADGQVLPTGCDSEIASEVYANLIEANSGPCEGVYLIAGSDACTHGPDFVLGTGIGALDEMVDSSEELASNGLGPAPPANLAAAVVSSSQINLSWTDNSDNEDGFKVEKSTDGGATWALVAKAPADVTAHSSTGLMPETSYSFRVRSYNAVGNSSYSNTASATTAQAEPPPPALPASPTNLTASASSSSGVDLSWTDNAANEHGFKIERSADGGTSWTQIDLAPFNSTTFTDTGVAAGATYHYRVRAFNADGASAYSNTAWATTPSVTPRPYAPTQLSAKAISSSQIDLSWLDNAGNESGFKVERSSDGGVNWALIGNVPTNTTNFNATGLISSTTYHFRVEAFNGGGDSGYSNVASATTTSAANQTPTHNGYEEEPGYDEPSDPDYQASVGSGYDAAGTADAEAFAANSESSLCAGDGRSGFRVQAVYAVADDQDSRYLKIRDTLRGWAQKANRPFFQSSADGHRRKIRYVCNGQGQVAIRKVVIPPKADNDLSELFLFLEFGKEQNGKRSNPPKGFQKATRKYMIWVDRAVSAKICGLGQVSSDEARSTSRHVNRADRGPDFGATYLVSCGGRGDNASSDNDNSTEAHELMHNLGAVHAGAPHSTQRFHCWDNWDIMCYDDEPPVDDGIVVSHGAEQRVRVRCTPLAPVENRFDCGNNDYYNSNPNLSGYLARFWNAADSRFLIPNTGATILDCEPESATNPPGTAHTITCTATDADGTRIGGARIAIEASGVNDPDGVESLGSPDFRCTTRHDDPSTSENEAGTCTITHGSAGTSSVGATTYRAWIDDDRKDSTVEADKAEGANEGSLPGDRPEPDNTDVVTKVW